MDDVMDVINKLRELLHGTWTTRPIQPDDIFKPQNPKDYLVINPAAINNGVLLIKEQIEELPSFLIFMNKGMDKLNTLKDWEDINKSVAEIILPDSVKIIRSSFVTKVRFSDAVLNVPYSEIRETLRYHDYVHANFTNLSKIHIPSSIEEILTFTSWEFTKLFDNPIIEVPVINNSNTLKPEHRYLEKYYISKRNRLFAMGGRFLLFDSINSFTFSAKGQILFSYTYGNVVDIFPVVPQKSWLSGERIGHIVIKTNTSKHSEYTISNLTETQAKIICRELANAIKSKSYYSKNTIYCKYCGKEISAESIFCRSCGTKQ